MSRKILRVERLRSVRCHRLSRQRQSIHDRQTRMESTWSRRPSMRPLHRQSRRPRRHPLGRRPVPRSPAGKRQIALSPLQRLDRGRLVDRQHHGVVRGILIKTNDSSALRHKRGIRALTPGFAARQVDLPSGQEAPNVLRVDVGQFARQQRSCPVGITRRRRTILHRQKQPFTNKALFYSILFATDRSPEGLGGRVRRYRFRL